MRRVLALLLLSVWPSARLSVLLAQCPDGTPPPCRAAQPATARRDPPLDERTWLVLPFENTARDTSVDLIRNASVSLMYQEMSRWQDVRIIPDNRVADLLRRAGGDPQGRLGLATATDLARRVGAGRLVLGSYVALRGRATVTATVYDVRGTRELRVVREPLSGLDSPAALDSLSASFGRLSRGVLAVPPSAQAASVGLGTNSVEAYRAYVTGITALNRLSLDSAAAMFARAVALDSNFALARLRLWELSTDTLGRQHLEAAIRLAESLPRRERAMVEGVAAGVRGDYERLCASANQLVADDSTEADAWVMLASCYFDPRITIEGGTARLRGNPTRGLRAAERAYALAPSSIDALTKLVQALRLISQMVCGQEPPPGGVCPLDTWYRLSYLLVGDSFVVTIRPWREARRAPADLAPDAVADVQRRLQRSRILVERQAATTPNSQQLNDALATISLRMGDTTTAARTFGRGSTWALDTVRGFRVRHLTQGMDLALARERTSEAAAYGDTLMALGVGLGPAHTLFGRFGESATTENGRLYGAWRPVLAGVLPAGFDTLESLLAARLTSPVREDFFQITTLAVFHMRRTGPALDTAAAHPIKRCQAWLARGDTLRARAALDEFDHELTARHPATPDDGGWLFSAESRVELGDSAVALERLREFGRRWVFIAPQYDSRILEQWYFQSFSARLWGRTWLLYADLAMAAGQRAEARRAYRMVVGLWEHGDPPVQPMVARARAALAQLGN